LIPGKIPPVHIQEEFAAVLYQLYDVALGNDKEILLFADPVHQIHNNENGYCWQLKGKDNTKTVLSNTGRRRLNIIGAINPVTLNPTILLTEENCCSEVIEVFLEEIRKQYKDANTICIVLDNARYQRSYEVREKAKVLGIDLLFLPPYCPNLNLIERLWKHFKKAVMKNEYYQSYQEFEDTIYNFFKNFDIQKEIVKTTLNFKFGIIKAS